MGRASAEDFVANASRDVALGWHLTSNHYPPIHPDFHPPIREAIELANCGEWDATVDLPNGITKTVRSVVQEVHLEPFIEWDEM